MKRSSRPPGPLCALAAVLSLPWSAPSALAARPKPAGAAAAPAGLGLLAPFLGTWHCEGTIMTSSSSPRQPFRSEAKIAYELDEHFIRLDLQQLKSRESPVPFKVVAFWAYDPLSRTFINRAFDNLGGFTVASAPETKEGRLAFSGEAQTLGEKLPTRLSFSVEGRKLSLTFELATHARSWFELLTQTCRR